ncbi:hypothetical protein LINGRAPRIM_LOCUS3003 [Linum grandiflorum]
MLGLNARIRCLRNSGARMTGMLLIPTRRTLRLR